MTQVQRPRLNVRRRGIVYGAECFDVDPETGFIRIDPATGAPRLRIDYVGKSRQTMSAREEQHRDEKPWADLIVRFVELERGQWLDEELAEREVYWIHRIRPRYNDRDNRGNPERIEIWSPARREWRQMEQRWARDDAAGRLRWIPPDHRAPAVAGSGPSAPDTGVSAHRLDPRSWPCWVQKVTLWSLAWLTATSVDWLVLDRNGWLPADRVRPLTAAMLPAVVLAVSLWADRDRWRRMIRAHRRTQRRLRKVKRWLFGR